MELHCDVIWALAVMLHSGGRHMTSHKQHSSHSTYYDPKLMRSGVWTDVIYTRSHLNTTSRIQSETVPIIMNE